jgi:hypothetical protein
MASNESSTPTGTIPPGMSGGRGDEGMRADQRVVTSLPLTELWDAHGALRFERGRAVGRERVIDLLRDGRVRFVLANCGHPLRWIRPDDCYRFWKEEVKPHLVEPDAFERGIRLEDWPGEDFFVGTEWGEDGRSSVVLLETHH